MSEQRTHVVVVGGGYAGSLAANHLGVRADVDVTLVNPRPMFVERIRLHQLVAGTHAATVDYGTMLGQHVQLVVDTAERIDTIDSTLALASGATLDFDYLIYAVGSTAAAPEFAYTVGEFEHAERLRGALEALGPQARITVVGGGLTGIETASELAEQGRRVTLVCGGVLGPSLARAGRRSVTKTLARFGVEILETAVVAEVRPNAAVLSDGAVLPSAVTIWTAGFGVPNLAARSGLRTDGLGRLLTDETLTSVDDIRIVAAGDSAAPSGKPLRMSCQAAIPLGAQAANTVLSRIGGTEPEPVNQAFTGQCISLGRSHATVQLARLDDTPINVAIGGRFGAPIKEVVCKGTVWGIRREAAKPGWYRWLKGGKRPQQIADAAVTVS
ncbi:pyridine nucleotide-disulfide oxidoreductase [Mycobacterium kyorinense]|uniref:Pyridine nucleotide-disulfide oxidoreductase n=1 Tax=Mycobacterium kyorinense TaxID=487514 RepID=A0A1A2Z3P4_9MYCO|nr:FAD-dependent oxidoreductase [Mycobacterium kyorinense]OBI43806.1 pyridine nucleotide-disulfide oxidoreductase [Mycobacterium kyorinense]